MKRKLLVRILVLPCALLIAFLPRIIEFCSIEKGSFEDVVLNSCENLTFDTMYFREASSHRDSPAVEGDEFNEALDYFKSLTVKTEFPQKSDKEFGDFSVNISGLFADKVARDTYRTGLNIEFISSEIMVVYGINAAKAYVIEGGIDMDYLNSFLDGVVPYK